MPITPLIEWSPKDTGPRTTQSPQLFLVPISQLRTSLQPLRGGGATKVFAQSAVSLAELPLRVVPRDDDFFEVFDGFKRREQGRSLGLERVPVVLEKGLYRSEHKVAVPAVNRPRGDLTYIADAKLF